MISANYRNPQFVIAETKEANRFKKATRESVAARESAVAKHAAKTLKNPSPKTNEARLLHSKVVENENGCTSLSDIAREAVRDTRIGHQDTDFAKGNRFFSLKRLARWVGKLVSALRSERANFQGQAAQCLHAREDYPTDDSRRNGTLPPEQTYKCRQPRELRLGETLGPNPAPVVEHHAVMDIELAQKLGLKTQVMSGFSCDEKPLFKATPCLADIKQADARNDCFLLSAIASIMSKEGGPEAIQDIMRDNGDGTVTVRLLNGKSEGVEKYLDITVSKDRITDADGYDQLSTGSVWVRCLEKAYYQWAALRNVDIDYSFPSGPLSALGHVIDKLEKTPLNQVQRENAGVTDQIRCALQLGYPVTIGTVSGRERQKAFAMIPRGLCPNHAYAVLGRHEPGQGAEGGFLLFDPVGFTDGKSPVIFITESEFNEFFINEAFYRGDMPKPPRNPNERHTDRGQNPTAEISSNWEGAEPDEVFDINDD